MSGEAHLIGSAVRALRRGGLVAFPTETVYGLGADATNASAVGRIYAAKGRPATNPLICHIANVAIARRYVTAWPQSADRLAAAFWPGPLTLVLPRLDAVGGVVGQATAGRPTVALRVPDHPLALELLRAFGGPVAAPSADRSTRVSPTTVQHVRDEFPPRLADPLAGRAGGPATSNSFLAEASVPIDVILDGGPCPVGIESTVLDLTTDTATILRPGGVTQAQIEELIGRVERFMGHIAVTNAAASPGQQAVHYSPRTPAYRFGWRDWPAVRRLDLPARSALLHLTAPPPDVISTAVEMPQSPEDYAAALYATLRHWDEQGVEMILIEMPPDEPGWVAVRDRLQRAAKEIA